MIQELNPAKLALLFRRQLELCKVKKGETIAAVSDLATRREYVQAAFAAADDLGADIYELCVNSLPSWTKVGVPTIGQCKGTLEAVRAADLVVIFHVPLFTRWLKQVLDGGTWKITTRSAARTASSVPLHWPMVGTPTLVHEGRELTHSS